MICYVYAICADRYNGPVKVGIANNPHQRLREIQTSAPFPLKLVVAFGLPLREIALTVESFFHKRHRETCAHGEWFNMRPASAAGLLCVYVDLAIVCSKLTDEEEEMARELSGVALFMKQKGGA